MNCHGKNNEQKNQEGHPEHKHCSMNHMLMMVVCCGLPLLLLFILPFLGILGTGFRLKLASIIPFICPIMMIFMIPMMLKSTKDNKSCCSENKEEPNLPAKK